MAIVAGLVAPAVVALFRRQHRTRRDD